MNAVVQKIKDWLKNQTSNLPHFIIRLTTIGILYSHIIGYKQWLNPDLILSPVTLPAVVYQILFYLIIVIGIFVIRFPQKSLMLILTLLVAAFLNIQIMSAFWYNYLLVLVFARYDASLQLVVWLIAIQEIWAGLNKINGDYGTTIGFISNPFASVPWLYAIIIFLTFCIPVFEILIGFGIVVKNKLIPYLVLAVHGGAIILLAFFVHYAQVVWLWNAYIIILVWTLFKKRVFASFTISWKKILIIAALAMAPLLQMTTTLAYTLSYRMYTGSESQLIIDGHFYMSDYYRLTHSTPVLIPEAFEAVLYKKCNRSEFITAKITAPKFLVRKPSSTSFICNRGILEIVSE